MGDLPMLARTLAELPPSVILAAGALLVPALPAAFRSLWFLLLGLLGLAMLWILPAIQMSDICVVSLRYAGFGLMPYVSDPLSRVFATAFLIVVMTGGLFAWHQRDAGEKTATLFYASGAIGVVLAGDYLTLFVFWELMAVASTWLIWSRRDSGSGGTGMRYLLYHVFGGGLLLAGILLEVSQTGSIQLQAFPAPSPDGGLWGTFSAARPGMVLILLGVAVNAALVPFHTWLSDAYPKASVTGAVFMSALTTKSAVYVLIRLFPGWDILVLAGLVMAIYGTLFALMSRDIRQIFSYSIIAQIGYMVTAIGIGSDIALNGAAAHAFSHILYKSLLFMTGGALLHSLGTSHLSEVGGRIREALASGNLTAGTLRLTFAAYIVGAFAISGLPLLNGFISKPMIIEAAGKAHLETGMLLLIVASIGTFLHTGLKIPYLAFAGTGVFSGPSAAAPKMSGRGSDDSETRFNPVPANMLLAMSLGALLCVAFGVMPWLLYDRLPFAAEYIPYRAYPIAESLQTMAGGFFVFILLKSWWTASAAPGSLRDLDQPFRALLPAVRTVFVEWVWAFFEAVERLLGSLTDRVVELLRNPLRLLQPWNAGSGQPAHSARDFTPAIEVVMALILLTSVVLGLFLLL